MELLVIAAAPSVATTWLVIKAGRDVANDEFLVKDLMYILRGTIGIPCDRCDQPDLRRARGGASVCTLYLPFRARQQG